MFEANDFGLGIHWSIWIVVFIGILILLYNRDKL